MTLELENTEVDKLARELAHTTGETVSQAVINALRERLERERSRKNRPDVMAETLLRIGQECAALTVVDNRHADEIIGYDAYGVPS
ncbi:MAG: type II toxin-antitoxin system VapB family antitoxin [Anaerolineae bacterium]|nr:type II toxin-antitoxin system VapB family antitoxin [Anaerolineae bacterium]